ncbi:hypothetical protein MJT46_017658 [Ovis ammon polii x Ovis aries]|nr:hypothetical protein MJT46_017658 [Ovis ammon polii x Ovis aries]
MTVGSSELTERPYVEITNSTSGISPESRQGHQHTGGTRRSVNKTVCCKSVVPQASISSTSSKCDDSLRQDSAIMLTFTALFRVNGAHEAGRAGPSRGPYDLVENSQNRESQLLGSRGRESLLKFLAMSIGKAAMSKLVESYTLDHQGSPCFGAYHLSDFVQVQQILYIRYEDKAQPGEKCIGSLEWWTNSESAAGFSSPPVFSPLIISSNRSQKLEAVSRAKDKEDPWKSSDLGTGMTEHYSKKSVLAAVQDENQNRNRLETKTRDKKQLQKLTFNGMKGNGPYILVASQRHEDGEVAGGVEV